MYESYFGFERSPFANVPDTSFFFGSSRHNEALAQLHYAVEGRKGFAVLTGEVGSGKTTITRALLRRLSSDTVTATITNSRLSGVQLLYSVAREFGISGVRASRPELLEAINEFLIHRLAEDRNVVLLVDEAQDLPLNTLEEVRLISNLETEKDKLIQIILIGQPELRDSIDHPELRQLRQRIAMRYHLSPLDQKETRDYIHHRMQIAGPTHSARFTERGLNTIFRYSHGIPRLINLACDKALLVAYTDDAQRIDQRVVMEGIREVEGRDFDFRSREASTAEKEEREQARRPFIRMPFLSGGDRRGRK